MKLVASIRRVDDSIKVPVQANPGDVGYDLCAGSDIIILKDELAVIPTGLIVEPPKGYNFEIRLRSSTPRRWGLLIPHGMGVIDCSYCGPGDELGISVYKFGVGEQDIHSKVGPLSEIKKGERLAQLVLVKTNYFRWEDITGSSFDNTSRGGFGSTEHLYEV